MKKTTNNLILCNMLFAVSLVIANVVTAKTIETGIPLFGGTIQLPGAAVCYAITFLMTDVIGEIWGKKEANVRSVGIYSADTCNNAYCLHPEITRDK